MTGSVVKISESTKLYNYWRECVSRKIIQYCKSLMPNVVLDIGCGDGKLTKQYLLGLKCEIFGIDLDLNRIRLAKNLIEHVILADACLLPFRDELFDMVIANQVIEHVEDIDTFMSEVRRVIKLGCYFILSTPNLSSLVNIIAIFLGFQDFSTHISRRRYVGNPLSPHYGREIKDELGVHRRTLARRALNDLLYLYGFTTEEIAGQGYLFFGGSLERILSKLDPVHSHFLTFKARRIR